MLGALAADGAALVDDTDLARFSDIGCTEAAREATGLAWQFRTVRPAAAAPSSSSSLRAGAPTSESGGASATTALAGAARAAPGDDELPPIRGSWAIRESGLSDGDGDRWVVYRVLVSSLIPQQPSTASPLAISVTASVTAAVHESAFDAAADTWRAIVRTEEPNVPAALVTPILVICIVLMVITSVVCVAVIRLRRHPIFRRSSPIFLCLTLGGCLMLFASVIAFGVSNSVAGACMLRPWLAIPGFTLMFAPLNAKTLRVHVIFNKHRRDASVKDARLLRDCTIILLTDLLFLVVWSAADPLVSVSRMVLATPTDVRVIPRCLSSVTTVWLGLALLVKLVLIAWGGYLAFAIRHVPIRDLNESAHISTCVYAVIMIVTLVGPVILIISREDEALRGAYMLTSLAAIAVVATVICVLFMPKFVRWFRERERSPGRGGKGGAGNGGGAGGALQGRGSVRIIAPGRDSFIRHSLSANRSSVSGPSTAAVTSTVSSTRTAAAPTASAAGAAGAAGGRAGGAPPTESKAKITRAQSMLRRATSTITAASAFAGGPGGSQQQQEASGSVPGTATRTVSSATEEDGIGGPDDTDWTDVFANYVRGPLVGTFYTPDAPGAAEAVGIPTEQRGELELLRDGRVSGASRRDSSVGLGAGAGGADEALLPVRIELLGVNTGLRAELAALGIDPDAGVSPRGSKRGSVVSRRGSSAAGPAAGGSPVSAPGSPVLRNSSDPILGASSGMHLHTPRVSSVSRASLGTAASNEGAGSPDGRFAAAAAAAGTGTGAANEMTPVLAASETTPVLADIPESSEPSAEDDDDDYGDDGDGHGDGDGDDGDDGDNDHQASRENGDGDGVNNLGANLGKRDHAAVQLHMVPPTVFSPHRTPSKPPPPLECVSGPPASSNLPALEFVGPAASCDDETALESVIVHHL
jgi:hypothetical protein